MRQGASASAAARTAIARIATKYPSFFGAVIAVDKTGAIGAACNGMQKFTFSVMNTTTEGAVLEYVVC